MCAVEAQRCVDCVSGVLHAVLTRAATLRALFDANRRAWRSWTSCVPVDDRLTCRRQRPRPWQIAHRSSCRMDPLYALLPDGTDPADLLALSGPTALAEALATAQPHAERLLGERLENLPPAQALPGSGSGGCRPARPPLGARQRGHQFAARYTNAAGPPRPAQICQRLEHRPAPSCATTATSHRRGQTPNINGRREPS